jgi:hypothetical protein
MLFPKAFKKSVEEDYWHLNSNVQIWDVVLSKTSPDYRDKWLKNLFQLNDTSVQFKNIESRANCLFYSH